MSTIQSFVVGFGCYLLHCACSLTIRPPPYSDPCIDKTKHPVVEVLYNEPLSINCTLLEGCALADVWWIKPDDTIVREQTLHQEAPHSPGIYSCFAHNQNGDDRYDVVLDIRGKYTHVPAVSY